MQLFRIKIQSYITYSQTPYDLNNGRALEYSKLPKSHKRGVIKFIRGNYPNASIREIIDGTYKAILEKGYLIGVQFDMNKL